jgi:hypothetical protein
MATEYIETAVNLFHEDEDYSIVIRRLVTTTKKVNGIVEKVTKELEILPIIRGSDLSWLSESNQRLANLWFEEHPEIIIE